MQADIGTTAGTVWEYLSQHGEATPSKLKQATKVGEPLLYMAIGWLAREDKLEFVQDKRTMRIALKSRAAA